MASEDAAGGDFTDRAHKDGTVRIARRGRVMTTLAGAAPARFLARVEGVATAAA